MTKVTPDRDETPSGVSYWDVSRWVDEFHVKHRATLTITLSPPHKRMGGGRSAWAVTVRAMFRGVGGDTASLHRTRTFGRGGDAATLPGALLWALMMLTDDLDNLLEEAERQTAF